LLPLTYVAILVGYYLFTLFLLRKSFSGSRFPVRLLLISLVLAEFILKLIDRYYFPDMLSRSYDEYYWLPSLAAYEKTGVLVINNETLAQGPGIYYPVAAVGTLFHIHYGSALIGLSVVFGSVYVVPVYLLYRVFFEGNQRLAFASTLLLSMSDVMIYSTTSARPTLFGLFLLPIAVGAFQVLRGRYRWSMFGGLCVVSIMILFMHAPITFVVLLAIVFAALIIFDRARKWEAAYLVFLFLSYGLMLKFFLPDLDRIWRNELFGGPLSGISSYLGGNFFLIFPVLGVGVLVLSSILGKIEERFVTVSLSSSLRSRKVSLFVVAALVFVTCIGSAVVLWKYSSYVDLVYGSEAYLLLMHSWKIVFGVVALLGLWKMGVRYKRTSNDTVFAWLLVLVVAVTFLASYGPILRFQGLWNMDERFAEFTYYPAFYFITVGLNYLSTRLPGRLFSRVFLPLWALYVIPSIIVGARIQTLVLQFLRT
jgi:hypothetical protein